MNDHLTESEHNAAPPRIARRSVSAVLSSVGVNERVAP